MKSHRPLLMRFSFLWFFFILAFPLPARSEYSHTVKPGESLFRIAKRFQVTVSQLQGANGLRDEKIYPGQRLVIPPAPPQAGISPTVRKAAQPGSGERSDADPDVPETHIVKKGETVAPIAPPYRLRVADPRQINQRSGEKLKAGHTLYPQGQEEAQEEFEAGLEKSGAEDLSERGEWGRDAMKGKGFLLGERDRQLLVRVARGFLGLKYRRGGSTPNGLDCSAFVQKVFAIFGIDLPRTTREQFQVGHQVAREALQIGDLVFFKRSKTLRPTHVGIYIGDGRFIHTSLRMRRVHIDNLDSRYFTARFIGAKRIEEVERSPESEEGIRNSARPGE